VKRVAEKKNTAVKVNPCADGGRIIWSKTPNNLAESIRLSACFREVSGLHLGWDTENVVDRKTNITKVSNC
jgi:hypothetical protein